MKVRQAAQALALTTALAATLSSSALAQCELPLAVQQGTGETNVLFILDTSGSMRTAITHEDYDPYAIYTGPFGEIERYYVSQNDLYSPESFDSNFPNTPTAPLVQSEHGKDGTYLGNYLNWVFYHADQTQRDNLPQSTRIEVGKAAISSVMNLATGLRYGLMQFDGETGGKFVREINESSTSVLLSDMSAIQAGGYTPTAETMVDALEYFQRTDSSAPITSECQQSFIILVTDGYPTRDLDIPAWIGDQDGDGKEPGDCASIGAPESNDADCSDYLDDVAYYLANNDMRSDLPGQQTVSTYTIGMGIDAPLLYDTALNGNGTYHVAWDLQSLSSSLGSVLSDILALVTATTAVAVVSADQTGDDRVYRSKFVPGAWHGYLEAHRLPYVEGQPVLWEAGSILAARAASDRNIFTSLASVKTEFTSSQASNLAAPMGFAGDTAAAIKVIDYIRGEDQTGMRNRAGWKLGDMVHASPLVVGRPRAFILDEGYQTYLANQASRAEVVYAGANDGMLHAFAASSGHELWAYVPQSLLGKLSLLSDENYCHQAYVDLSPVAYEIKIAGAWRTVLIGGTGKGSDSYFALDITSPSAPEVLWETSVPEVGTSYTRPALVRAVGGDYLWVGSSPDTGGTASIALLDAATGSVVFTADVGSVISNTNATTEAVAYDHDWDGLTDYVYQGDLAGNIWRWDVRDADPLAWTGAALFSGTQPIQAPPTLAVGPANDVLVYFGTGRYLDTNDILNVDSQSFYSLRDDLSQTSLSRSSLVNQTSSVSDITTEPGWYVDLVQASGERVTKAARVIEGVVYFTSFTPGQSVCGGAGQSWVYRLEFLDGNSPNGNLPDRIVSLGSGIATAPVVHLEEGELAVQTSDARVTFIDMNATPRRMIVNNWREKFEIFQEGGN